MLGRVWLSQDLGETRPPIHQHPQSSLAVRAPQVHSRGCCFLLQYFWQRPCCKPDSKGNHSPGEAGTLPRPLLLWQGHGHLCALSVPASTHHLCVCAFRHFSFSLLALTETWVSCLVYSYGAVKNWRLNLGSGSGLVQLNLCWMAFLWCDQ